MSARARDSEQPYHSLIYYLCLQATREGQASHAHVHEIIKGLRRRGWQVVLFEPPHKEGSRVAVISKIFYFSLVVFHMIFCILRKRPSCLYIRHHPFAFPAATFARIWGLPVVLEVNSTYDELFLVYPWSRALKPLFIWILRSPLRWARAVVTVTEPLVAWCRSEAKHERVAMISNGANTDLFTPEACHKAQIPIDSPYVLFFGALAVWQGIETLIEAAERPEWPHGVALVIIGRGVHASLAEAASKECENIHYIPFQPYTEMPAWISRSLACTAPKVKISDRMGVMPLKLFEALACGVPVIVSDIPGMAGLVRQYQCGVVVPPGDAVALAQAVSYLYSHPEEAKAMGLRGRAAIVAEHSWDRRAQQTHELLLEVVCE